jgi:hypothetical protein
LRPARGLPLRVTWQPTAWRGLSRGDACPTASQDRRQTGGSSPIRQRGGRRPRGSRRVDQRTRQDGWGVQGGGMKSANRPYIPDWASDSSMRELRRAAMPIAESLRSRAASQRCGQACLPAPWCKGRRSQRREEWRLSHGTVYGASQGRATAGADADPGPVASDRFQRVDAQDPDS